MATDTAAQQTIDVVTPAAGESVTEGTVLEWHVKVGDFIKADDTIVELSTDKVDLELPSPASGTVSEILVEEGETVTVGQVIARIVTNGSGAGRAGANGGQIPSEQAPPEPEQAPPPEPGTPPAPTDGAAPAQAPENVKASPVAARAAAVEGVNLASVPGSGPAGRITKSDVLTTAFGGGAPASGGAAQGSDGAGQGAGNGAPATAPANGRTGTAARPSVQPMKGGAAALARYMEESRSIPTATSFRTLTVTVLDARRRELKAAERKVSFTHLIAYAIARAAADMPVMGNHFAEIDGKPHRIEDHQVNLGLAVDVEKRDGSRTLMVPVILDAGSQSFEEFPPGLRRACGEGAYEHPHRR